jgi:hypothetical protein
LDILDTPFDEDGVTIKQFLRTAAVAMILASLPTAYWAWQRERDLTAVRTYWAEATATVTSGTDHVRRGLGRSRRYNHHYYLTLSWSDETGRERTFTRGVNSFLFFRMEKASGEARQLSIRYFPSRPDIAPVIADDVIDSSNLYLYGAAGLIALGLCTAWFAWPPRRAGASPV